MARAELLADATDAVGDELVPGARVAITDHRSNAVGAFRGRRDLARRLSRAQGCRQAHLPTATGRHMFSGRTATLPLPALPTGSPDGLVADIGGTKLLLGAVRQGVIAKKRSFRISQFAGPADLMDVIAAAGRKLCGSVGTPVESAVVAVAGRIDRASGTVMQSANLPFADFPLADELSKRLDGAAIRIEHDAVCGLIGETAAGAARGFANVIYLTVSTGISVGILVDGAVLEGAHGVAGEIGHAPVESPGIACPCGSSGCLEAYASGRALAELGRQAAVSGASPGLAATLAAGGVITAREVLSAGRRGDSASARIVDDAIGLITRVIRMLLMALDPELVVLGGGVMSSSYFASRIVAGVGSRGGQPARVRRAELGARSVMYGGMAFLAARNQGSPLDGRTAGKGERLERPPPVSAAGPPASSDTP